MNGWNFYDDEKLININPIVFFFIVYAFFVYVCFLMFTTVNTIEAEETIAQDNKQIVVICFEAVWCKPCEKMKRETWSNPQLKKYLKDNEIELHHIDVDKDKKTSKAYGVSSIPCVVVLERISKDRAKEIDRFIGLKSAKEVQAFIERCRTKETLFSIIGEGVKIDDKIK